MWDLGHYWGINFNFCRFGVFLQGKFVPPSAFQKSPICEAGTSQTQKCFTRGLQVRILQIQNCFMPVCEVRGLQFKALEDGSVRVRMSTNLAKCTARCKGDLRHARNLQVLRRALKCNKTSLVCKIFIRALQQTSQISHLAAKKVLLCVGYKFTLYFYSHFLR